MFIKEIIILMFHVQLPEARFWTSETTQQEMEWLTQYIVVCHDRSLFGYV